MRNRLQVEIKLTDYIAEKTKISFDRRRALKLKCRYALLKSLLELRVINKRMLSLSLLEQPEMHFGANPDADQ